MKDDQNQTTDPLTDAKWLYEYQKLVTNVRAWLSRGLTETAMREIDAMQDRWTEACNVR